MDCTTCMYEYVCNWAEAGHCGQYKPDLEQEEAEDEARFKNSQSESGRCSKSESSRRRSRDPRAAA